jgi:hypothetical protein
MGAEKHLLMLSNIGYLQIVLDGAEPVVRIGRCSALREHKWVGVLKVCQAGPWRFLTISSFVVIVMVSRGKLCDLSQCRDVGLVFCVGSLAILRHEAQELGHVDPVGVEGCLGLSFRGECQPYDEIIV